MKYKVFVSKEPFLEVLEDERLNYVSKDFETIDDAMGFALVMAEVYQFHVALITEN